MAASPALKVYRGGEYVASCKFFEDAAALVALSEEGTIKFGHSVTLWREGNEEFPAGESYDECAAIMRERLQQKQRESYEKAYGKPA